MYCNLQARRLPYITEKAASAVVVKARRQVTNL